MLILNFWTYLFVVWYQKFGAWLGSTLSLTWTLTHGHTAGEGLATSGLRKWGKSGLAS